MLEQPVPQEAASKPNLRKSVVDVTQTLSLAEKFAFNQQNSDGHWCAEFHSQVDPTAQHVIFHQAWGTDLSADASQLRKFILSLQTSDGSWTVAPDYPGNISSTAEAYLALRILDFKADSKELLLARDFIREAGGLAKVRVITRFLLALFGLFPWKAVPQVPPELMLLPTWSPFNLFSLPFYSRHAVVLMALIRHHEPIFALPNGRSADNDFLDELWLDPRRKSVPYGRPFLELWMDDPVGFALKTADHMLHALGMLRYSPLRYLARKQTVKWLLQHQNKDGSWSGFTLAFQCAMTALLLEGFTVHDSPIRRGLAAFETWTLEDDTVGKRIQMCTSPTWDTALMLEGLCAAGIPQDDDRLQRAADWLKKQQLFGRENDVALYCPDLQIGGGWAFQYDNSWVPDVDDTTQVILSLFAQDSSVLERYWCVYAAEWAFGMQNKDEGFASFERDCNHQWLHKFPFNDLNNLADPSTADITSRVLELCTVIIRQANSTHGRPPAHLVRRVQQAVPGIIRFIASKQENDGSWWCRWGVNYVPGTSSAISALAPYVEKGGRGPVADMVRQGAAFIIGIQHSDGGWGETVASYDSPALPKGQGPSLPSSTGWALIGLLRAGIDPMEPAIQRGVSWLVSGQTDLDDLGGASWPERHYTGVGFPGKMYLGYGFYRHYFPMLALGKYIRALTATSLATSVAISRDGDEKAALLN